MNNPPFGMGKRYLVETRGFAAFVLVGATASEVRAKAHRMYCDAWNVVTFREFFDMVRVRRWYSDLPPPDEFGDLEYDR